MMEILTTWSVKGDTCEASAWRPILGLWTATSSSVEVKEMGGDGGCCLFGMVVGLYISSFFFFRFFYAP
jgi:hypothetical protein